MLRVNCEESMNFYDEWNECPHAKHQFGIGPSSMPMTWHKKWWRPTEYPTTTKLLNMQCIWALDILHTQQNLPTSAGVPNMHFFSSFFLFLLGAHKILSVPLHSKLSSSGVLSYCLLLSSLEMCIYVIEFFNFLFPKRHLIMSNSIIAYKAKFVLHIANWRAYTKTSEVKCVPKSSWDQKRSLSPVFLCWDFN